MEPHPIRVVVQDDQRRSRLTVFFRLLLAIPHFIWFVLWSIVVFFVAILSWFITLIAGACRRPLHNFSAAYVRYATHLFAYLYLAANDYPRLRRRGRRLSDRPQGRRAGTAEPLEDRLPGLLVIPAFLLVERR